MLLLVVSSRILGRDAQSTSKARVPKRSYANFSPSCPQPSSSGHHRRFLTIAPLRTSKYENKTSTTKTGTTIA